MTHRNRLFPLPGPRQGVSGVRQPGSAEPSCRGAAHYALVEMARRTVGPERVARRAAPVSLWYSPYTRRTGALCAPIRWPSIRRSCPSFRSPTRRSWEEHRHRQRSTDPIVSAGSVAGRQAASYRAAGPWAVLVVVCFAQFMVILDATIVNVALPSIETGLSLSASNLRWVINAYSLTLGGLLLLGGRAGDILGRKRIFMVGLVLFSTASLANGLATSSLVLILGRAVQGVGGALIVPAVLSIITTNFTTALDREKAVAAWSAITATGGAVGLLLGGVLTSALSWRWIFLVNVPVGILVMLATMRIVPESRAPDSKRAFDAAGAALVTAGLGVFVFGVVKSEAWGWGSARTWAPVVAGLVLITVFLALEQRSSAPLMRLGVQQKYLSMTSWFKPIASKICAPE